MPVVSWKKFIISWKNYAKKGYQKKITNCKEKKNQYQLFSEKIYAKKNCQLFLKKDCIIIDVALRLLLRKLTFFLCND